MDDCEAAHGLLAQDVNALSSFAFVLAGVAVVAAVRRGRLRPPAAWFAVLATGEGAGSLLFHGAPSRLADLAHDAPLLGLVAYGAGWHVGRARSPAAADRWAVAASVAALAVAGVAWLVDVGATTGLTVVLVAAGGLSAMAPSARRLAAESGAAAVWTPGLLVAGAAGIAAWFAGRSTSPWCDPTSWWQPHAVWHVVAAGLLAAWIVRTAANRGDGAVTAS